MLSFASFEKILDLAVAATGIIACIAGMFVAWHLIRSRSQAREADAKPDPYWSKKTTPPAVAEVSAPREQDLELRYGPRKEPYQPEASLPEGVIQQPEPAAVYEPAAGEESTGADPRLEAERLVLLSAGTLQFTLRNHGGPLTYLGLAPGNHNELMVTFEPDTAPIAADTYLCPPGGSLTFTLSGYRVNSRTYHFLIRYLTASGQELVQEIAGMGREHPLLEAPVAPKARVLEEALVTEA
jgi:hypothetical protein